MVGENGEDLRNPEEFLPISKLEGANDDSSYLGLLPTRPISWIVGVSPVYGGKKMPLLGENI